MKHSIDCSSAQLITLAKTDARRSVSKWCWGTLGLCLSFLPIVNVVAVGIAILIAYLLIPKIDLSTSEKVGIYSQHPALYTDRYRKTVRITRILCILCGWIIGVIFIVIFSLF